MHIRMAVLGSVLTVAIAAGPAFAQKSEPGANKATGSKEIKVVGCVQWEKDYRQARNEDAAASWVLALARATSSCSPSRRSRVPEEELPLRLSAPRETVPARSSPKARRTASPAIARKSWHGALDSRWK